MLEKEFQASVVQLARLQGWFVHHARTVAYAKGGYGTPVLDPGFPDLVLAHPTGGLVFAELKSHTGQISGAQQNWLNLLENQGAEVYLWRPSDWSAIQQRLKTVKPVKN